MTAWNRKEKRSLSRRITQQITALVVLTAVLLAVISYRSLESTYMRLYNEKAQDIVRILASKIDGDELEKYVTTGETDEYYDWLQNELSLTKSNFTGIQYLYLVWPGADRFIYIAEGVKADDDPDNISSLGDVYEYGEMEYAHFAPDVNAVATMEDMRFREHEFELNPGDALYVYTDGVTEATNAENVLFGEERTTDALNRDSNASVEQILKTVKREIDAFVGEAVQFDDITMLGTEYYGKEGKKNGGTDG